MMEKVTYEDVRYTSGYKVVKVQIFYDEIILYLQDNDNHNDYYKKVIKITGEKDEDETV